MALKLEKENEYDVSPEDVKQYLAEEAAEPKESDTSDDTTQNDLQPSEQTNDPCRIQFQSGSCLPRLFEGGGDEENHSHPWRARG